MGYVKNADENTVIISIRQITDQALLRQLMGIGVRGKINRALNAQLERVGG